MLEKSLMTDCASEADVWRIQVSPKTLMPPNHAMPFLCLRGFDLSGILATLRIKRS